MSRFVTNYPITALGDKRNRRAPLREIEVKRCTKSWCQIIIHEPRIELHVEVPVDRVYCKPRRRRGKLIPISASTIHRINNPKG